LNQGLLRLCLPTYGGVFALHRTVTHSAIKIVDITSGKVAFRCHYHSNGAASLEIVQDADAEIESRLGGPPAGAMPLEKTVENLNLLTMAVP
jgi:hypothetical protein